MMKVVEDVLAAGTSQTRVLPPLNRVLYVIEGTLMVASPGRAARVVAGEAWYGREPCEVGVTEGSARALRFELYRDPPPPDDSIVLLAHPIDLDPGAAWLMRCDRVDFEPAGEAPPHRHRGGGIRCLLRGRLDVTVGAEPPRRIHPGGAWFESGRERDPKASPIYRVRRRAYRGGLA
jgi:quercetin dioxygenase-like cupin family protein